MTTHALKPELTYPVKHLKDILSAYEDVDQKTVVFGRLCTIMWDIETGFSGITSSFKNVFCNAQITDVTEEWLGKVNRLIVDDITNSNEELLGNSIGLLKEKYGYKASYDL